MTRYHVTAYSSKSNNPSEAEKPNGFIVETSEINDSVVKYKLYAVEPSNYGDHILLMEGSLKWDGCTDARFVNSIHFCGGLDDWVIFNEAVKVMFTKAYELLDEVSKEHGGVSEFSPWIENDGYILTINKYDGEINLSEKG